MRSVRKVMLPVVFAAALAGCAQMGAGSVDGVFGPRASRTQLAFAALAQGDFVQAQSQADQALATDPGDPYAMFARAVALRYTGREREAAELFSRLTESERAREAAMAGGAWNAMAPTTVARAAREQLASMKVAGGIPATLTPAAPEPILSAAPPAANAPAGAEAVAAMGAPMQPPLSGIELLNAAQRFLVLRRLRDDGMLTEGEYATRRGANIGALLPYSSKIRPADGLGRPVPTAEQVMARLEALRQSLTGGSLRPEEHFAEREAILDAILPADPRSRMAPPSPPASLADAAERADALQRLRDMGAISKEEYARERAALEKAAGRLMTRADGGSKVLVPKAPAKKAAGASAKSAAPKATPTVLVPKTDAEALAAGRAGGDQSRMVGQGPTVVAAPTTAPAPAKAAGGAVVLHLASYKSRQAAEAGWADLRARHGKLLGPLSPQFAEVDLGAGRGTYWRLNAGPLADSGAAERLCGQLAAQGQYCRTAFAGG